MATEATIELKFDGNGIKPSNVSVSEIAKLLVSYERAIVAVIKANNPEVNDDYVFLSFDEVREGSLSLKFKTHLSEEYVLPAYEIITASFESHNFNLIPAASIEDLRVITAFAKRHECEGHFMKNGASLAMFDQYTDVGYNDAGIIKGETTIYGKVEAVAGDKENQYVILRINDQYTIKIAITENIALQLETKLYNEVGLKGVAKWNKTTFRVMDFEIDSVIILEHTSLDDTFKDLGTLLGTHINEQGDYNTYLS